MSSLMEKFSCAPYQSAEDSDDWERATGEDEATRDCNLETQIERAEEMLRNGTDDEDVPMFSRNALDRAIALLWAQSAHSRREQQCFSPTPHIGPGPEGSVDLFWKRVDWELLINIPSNITESITYFGDRYGTKSTKGHFESDDPDLGIIDWLSKK